MVPKDKCYFIGPRHAPKYNTRKFRGVRYFWKGIKPLRLFCYLSRPKRSCTCSYQRTYPYKAMAMQKTSVLRQKSWSVFFVFSFFFVSYCMTFRTFTVYSWKALFCVFSKNPGVRLAYRLRLPFVMIVSILLKQYLNCVAKRYCVRMVNTWALNMRNVCWFGTLHSKASMALFAVTMTHRDVRHENMLASDSELFKRMFFTPGKCRRM